MRIITTALFVLLTSMLSHAQDLYDTDQITIIEITFEESNWNEILNDFFIAGDNERLMGAVEINGEQFDSVGIRFRGGSTFDLSNAKNPLNIKLDYLKNQDFQGYEVLKLSNGAKDPSWLREVLSYEIARNYMEAPRANYASVYVNGSYLGLYANIESVNSKFFSDRFFSDNDNTRFEAAPDYAFNEILTPPFGCLEGHGGALEFLGPNDVCYFSHYDIQSDTGWDELRALGELLQNNPQNARSTMDIDRFIWMNAFNNLLMNLDSYLGPSPRNYYIFKADNGHWVPVIEDLNESFARFPWATIPQPGEPQPALGFYTDFDPFWGETDNQKPLLKATLSDATWRKMYVAHMRTMISEIFTSGWFEQRSESLQNLINDEVLSDDNHFYTHDDFINNFNETVIDSYNGEDAFGLFSLMDGRISHLQSLSDFQAAPPVIADVAASTDMPTPGSSIFITANLSDEDNVWLGYRNNLREMFELVQMSDDGMHGDGAAGDGIYGAEITVGVGGIQYYVYAENNGAGIFSPERAEFEFYSLGTFSDVVINELMASNQTTAADQNGEFDDWVELLNNTSNTIDLSGWYLSDDPTNLTKWQFPTGTLINSQQHLIVWTDDDEAQGDLHTNFKLSADGEAVILVTSDLTIADQVIFGAQTTDVSLARCPNGTGSFSQVPPSFGENNSAACSTPNHELVDMIGLTIFPNPATDQLWIEAEKPQGQTLSMVTYYGQKVKSLRLVHRQSIDLSELPPGIYFLEIEGVVTQKVIVAR